MKKVLALLARPLLLPAQVWNPKQCFCCELCELQTQRLFRSRLVSDLGVPGLHYSFCLPCSLQSRHLTFAVSKALPLAVPPALCLRKFSSVRIPVWILGSKVESSGPTTLTLAEQGMLHGPGFRFPGSHCKNSGKQERTGTPAPYPVCHAVSFQERK